MNELSISAWAVLGISAFLIGVSKSGMPGAGVLAVPLMAAVLPARASTGLLLPLLIVGDLIALLRFRRHAERRYLVKLLPSALVGIVVGAFALGAITDHQLRPLIGVIILVLLALHTMHVRRGGDIPLPQTRWIPAGTGAVAGITTMMANAAGPIMTLYFLAMHMPKQVFIGTAAWFFLIVNVSKVPFSAYLGLITPDSLAINAWLAPAVLMGSWTGARLLHLLPQRIFEWIARILAAIAAIYLIF